MQVICWQGTLKPVVYCTYSQCLLSTVPCAGGLRFEHTGMRMGMPVDVSVRLCLSGPPAVRSSPCCAPQLASGQRVTLGQ